MNRRLLILTFAVGIWSTHAAAQMPPGSYAQSCRDVRFDGYTLSALCNAMQGPPQRTTIRADQCAGPIMNSNGQLVCQRGGQRDERYGRGEPPYGGGQPRYDRDERSYREERPYRGGYEEPRGGYGPPPYREERGYGGPPGGDRPPGGYDRPPQGYGPPPAAGYGPPPGPPPGAGGPPPQQARPAPPPGGGLPPGSWAGSCTNAQMQGATLVASCKSVQGTSVQTSIDVRTCKTIANQNGRLVCG